MIFLYRKTGRQPIPAKRRGVSLIVLGFIPLLTGVAGMFGFGGLGTSCLKVIIYCMADFNWEDVGYFATDARDISKMRRVLVVTMLLNFLATGVKISAGLLTGALSVVADGLDSLFDGLSNVAGLVGLYAGSRPPDAEHPYGHRKFETVAAISISILLFITSWQLFVLAWGRFRNASKPEISFWVVGAMLVSMIIQGLTSYYELRQGRSLQSEILVADAMHTRASIWVSLSVLGGLGFVALGFHQADAILAAFVAIVIAKIGVDILRENLPVLVDRAAVNPQKIAEVVSAVGGVETFHRVRSRGAAGSAAVDLHIQVSSENTIEEANAIADEVRRRLLALDEIADVTVHIEAHHEQESSATDIFSAIWLAANELGLVLHESWVHSADGKLTVEIHVGVDPQSTLGGAHALVDRLEREIKERLPQLEDVHTHIELADRDIQETDSVPLEYEDFVRRQVEEIVSNIPALNYPHKIIIRKNRTSNDKLFISLECTADPETPIIEAHDMASAVEDELKRRLDGMAEVSIHLEPPEQA
jgi:cation diffusion facilitator family transporter